MAPTPTARSPEPRRKLASVADLSDAGLTINTEQAEFIQSQQPPLDPNSDSSEAVAYRSRQQMLRHREARQLQRQRADATNASAGAEFRNGPRTNMPLSPQKFDGSILDVEGLSGARLSNADTQFIDHLVRTVHRDPEFFHQEVHRNYRNSDGARTREPGREAQDAGKYDNVDQDQHNAAAESARGDGILGSEFSTLDQMNTRMRELRESQSAALVTAVKAEMEMKRIYWLRQYSQQRK